MNKSKYLLTTLSLFIMLPSITYAECTSEEIKHFKEIEDEYKYSYEFDSQTKKYNIRFYSEEPDNYDFGIMNTRNLDCTINDEKTFECKNVEPGTYEVIISGRTDSCNEVLKKEKIKLAKYNEYSDDPLCEGIEEFVLCQETYDKNIDYETFESRVNTYRKTKKNHETDMNAKEQNKSKFVYFIGNNLFKIIIVGIFIIAVIVSVALSLKSIKRSRRLE